MADFGSKQKSSKQIRNTSQELMPVVWKPDAENSDGFSAEYRIYPFKSLGNDKIYNGFATLGNYIIKQRTVVIDGYAGVFWDKIEDALSKHFKEKNLTVNWIKACDYLKSEEKIKELIQPYLGEKESVWGTKCLLNLEDLFESGSFKAQQKSDHTVLNIVIGTGAALINWECPIVYIDLPKNELQYRMRAGSANNIGANQFSAAYEMYKRAYFVDWVLLNAHKKKLLDKMSVVVDGQTADDINWMFKSDLLTGLNELSESVFRVRPWFEPGAWGGQWIKKHINGLNKEVINYAWSFELIVPENGIVFESNGFLLEVSFDFLMFKNNSKILGKHASIFRDEFPIRFDFLDTFQGGNLSIQCHPKLDYIQRHFGENITQDETYYILDCDDDAKVYLGFQEDINPEGFKKVLENSLLNVEEVSIEDYVQVHPAKKHDLFLIPNGTIHSAGAGNLVLEISATPYIFTFKMYDWLRLDLDGNPRPINIDHAFKNLDFKRKGASVKRDLIAKQLVLEKGADWQIIHLPTHEQHFYDVHRLEFRSEIYIQTHNVCHVLMLVEGTVISIETFDGTLQDFVYAETFVVPAAAKSYRLRNKGTEQAKVIQAFLK